MGYLTNTVFYDDIVVVVCVVVLAVFDKVAVDVLLSLEGSPSFAYVGRDVDDLEGSKETVVYALPEAVFIDRLPK